MTLIAYTLAASLAGILAGPPATASLGDGPYRHAQTLADRTVAGNPGMIDTIIHVSPTDGAKNIVIAAHLRKANGEDSGEDDLGVMRTGAPLVEVQKDGVRVGVVVQLRDARKRPIGALGLMYRYTPGADVEAMVRRSFAVRDHLAAEIPSRDALAAVG